MKELTGEGQFEREVLASGNTIAVVFEANWCPFCRSFMPIMERYAKKFPVPVLAAILDDWNDPLWDRFSVKVVPTLAVFSEGRLRFRIDGLLGAGLTEDDVQRLIDYLLKDKILRSRARAGSRRVSQQ